MKNIIYIIALIFSSSMYSQNSDIEKDVLYQQYEKQYAKLLADSGKYRTFDELQTSFVNRFAKSRDFKSFQKDKDKNRWLTKNYSKIGFNSAQEALSSYNKFMDLKAEMDVDSKNAEDLKNQLVKKYDAMLLFETLKKRLK